MNNLLVQENRPKIDNSDPKLFQNNRLDKRQSKLEHTIIKTDSGNKYELLNTLSRQETDELLSKTGVSSTGKSKLGEGGYGKIRFARNLDTGALCAIKKVPFNPLKESRYYMDHEYKIHNELPKSTYLLELTDKVI